MIAAADNPFRMQRIERVPFEPQDTDWPALMQRLAALNYRAAVRGPHGSGKTAFMEQLMPRLRALGRTPRLVRMNTSDGASLPPWWHEALAQCQPNDVLLADGYELLRFAARRRLRRETRVLGAGLIVTAHRPVGLPTLLRCRTNPALLGHSLPEAHIAQLYRQHHGNLRDALRALYDEAAAGRLAN